MNRRWENHDDSDALWADALASRTWNDSWATHLERSLSGASPIRLRAAANQPICRPDRAGEPSLFGGTYRVHEEQLEARIEMLLSKLDLTANRDTVAARLSGGVKQLLSISCASTHEPSVLFLDEPTAGLDPVHRQSIWSLLYK